jgi:hypothetical protein
MHSSPSLPALGSKCPQRQQAQRGTLHPDMILTSESTAISVVQTRDFVELLTYRVMPKRLYRCVPCVRPSQRRSKCTVGMSKRPTTGASARSTQSGEGW